MTVHSRIETRFAAESDHLALQAMLATIDQAQAIAEYSATGVVLRANDNFIHMLGYGAGDLAGRHYLELCLPGDERHESLWALLAQGQGVSGEFVNLAMDGRHLWLMSHFHPVLDSDGVLQRVMQFASDITENKAFNADVQARLAAIDRVQAVIEFDLGGHILHANDNFLELMGYRLEDIQGRHHSLFCTPEYCDTPAYAAFWDHLAAGHVHSGEFKRLAKDGREVWIQASYNPVLDPEGQPVKVIKFATDITERKQQNAEVQAMMDAIHRVQGVIEFDLSGHVLHANDNFLHLMGYTLAEVRGQHHRMFCDAAYSHSPEYETFWEHLASGHVHRGEFRRLNRHGKEIWIQASYNPVFAPDGYPVKVVKFASDITATRQLTSESSSKIEALSRSQAIIEFDLQGNVLSANANFERTLGYPEHEILGRHHSLFCSPELVASPEYRHFWADLAQGSFKSGRFCRRSKHGADVWIQATYNPIFDPSGKPVKIVKFAMDVTEQVHRERLIAEQVNALSEALAALEDITQRIGEATQRSRASARESGHDADESHRLLTSSQAAASQIRNTSDEVQQVLDLIGDIAGQSRQTALNASIEAARASEHGLGVVTEELRRLADRSTDAVRELAKHLGQAGRKAEENCKVSRDIEDTLRRMTRSVDSAQLAMNDVHEAARQQALNTQRFAHLLGELKAAVGNG